MFDHPSASSGDRSAARGVAAARVIECFRCAMAVPEEVLSA